MKKIVKAAMGLMAGMAMLMTAAACSAPIDYAAVSAAYEKVHEAQTIVKSIEVERDGTELSGREERYEKTESGYTLTVSEKTLNEIGQGSGMYEERTESTQVGESEVTFGTLPAEGSFTNAVYEMDEKDVTMTAEVSAGALGLASGDVSGSIFCTIEVTDGSLTSISLSYATPNGNDVSINFTFQY